MDGLNYHKVSAVVYERNTQQMEIKSTEDN